MARKKRVKSETSTTTISSDVVFAEPETRITFAPDGNRWKIVKTTHTEKDDPYAGVACEKGKVTPGKIYLSKAEAEADVKKLNPFSGVGFKVVSVRK